jgi:hypothetical protein
MELSTPAMPTAATQLTGIGVTVEHSASPDNKFLVVSVTPGEASARDGSIRLSRPDIMMQCLASTASLSVTRVLEQNLVTESLR